MQNAKNESGPNSTPPSAPNARFKGKRNKGRQQLRWIDDTNEDITALWLTLKGPLDSSRLINDNGSRVRINSPKWLASGTNLDDDQHDHHHHHHHHRGRHDHDDDGDDDHGGGDDYDDDDDDRPFELSYRRDA